MDRNSPVSRPVQIGLALALAAIAGAVVAVTYFESGRPAPAAAAVPAADGMSISFRQAALLEAVGPEGETIAYDDGSRAVIISYDLTNHSRATVAAGDLPVVQLFDRDGGAWTSDMVFVPGPDGELFYSAASDIGPGATLPMAAIFSIPGDDWARPGWTGGRRGASPGERWSIN